MREPELVKSSVRRLQVDAGVACRAMLAALILAAAAPGEAWSEDVAFETGYVRLVLDESGCARSLLERATQRELLRHVDEPFVVLRVRGVRMPASRLERNGGRLVFAFARPGYEAVLRIEPGPSHLVVHVDELRGDGIEALEFARLPIVIGENVASTLVMRWDSKFTVAMVGARESVETAHRGGVMASAVYAEPGLAGGTTAILAVPTHTFERAMQDLEVALGLPSPRLGGVWAKLSEDLRKSYLFVDLTEANADEVIRWAHLGGFATILVYSGTWAESPGSYRIHTGHFPRGEASLAATIRRLHAAGLRVGMHCLTSLVGKRDPLAAPRPDSRLLKDATSRLAADLPSTSTEIQLEGGAHGFPGSSAEGGMDVQIGEEVIRYRRKEADANGRIVRLAGCERGANGTRSAPHLAGAEVQHLVERQGSYLADLRSSLPSEIADRLAGLVDRVEFDMIYLDAGELNDANGPFWYWAGRQQEEILRRIRRPILVQGSGTTPWTWHRFSRGACDDAVAVGRDAWLELHKIGKVLPYYRRNRMPAELGWWALYAAAPGRPATTRAEADQLGARSAALDVPFSVETTIADLVGNPASEDILRTLARFERARLERTVPVVPPTVVAETGAVRSVARVPLLDGSAEPLVLDVPTRVRVAAGTLASRINLEAVGVGSFARGLAALWSGSSGVDLSSYAGIAVTVDVSGPEPGPSRVPVVNFQLETKGTRYRDHLVDLDFRGERTLVMEGPSADRVIRELPPAPGTYSLKSSLIDVDLARTVALNVRWMRGADASGLTVRVRRVEVLSRTPSDPSSSALMQRGKRQVHGS